MTTTEIDVFHDEEGRANFESYARQNGFRFWLASEVMEMLGYATMQPIFNAVNKAINVCAQVGIPIEENFKGLTGANGKDWQLSRFAVYVTVMNCDSKKPQVARAQAYFAAMTEAFRQYIQDSEDVERVAIRGEVSEREKALSATAYTHGVVNYPFFQNAGYRGLYNLDLKQIRVRKQVPVGRSPLDYMGKTELAANLFRITQTDEKIRAEDITGQKNLERAAEHVGKTVRQTMINLSGRRPEELPPANDIKDVKKGLKQAGKKFALLDHQKEGSRQ